VLASVSSGIYRVAVRRATPGYRSRLDSSRLLIREFHGGRAWVEQDGASVRPADGPDDLVPQDLDAAVTGLGLAPLYQPVVSLPGGATVGFEALARWPTLNNPEPLAVFARAVAAGRVDQLDRACIDAAVRGALDAGLPRGTLLLVNCEPVSEFVRRADDDVLARGHAEFRLMFELTERSLLTHPHALLRKVAALRSDGFAIALDDVGAHPDSLALLDVISPDVIKLDLDLVQSQPRYDQARTLAAIFAHHERTGAIILAEGIETAEHLQHALALGASLGQGFRFGPPGPLDTDLHPPVVWSPVMGQQLPRFAAGSPFDIVASKTMVRPVRKDSLLVLSRYVESQASHATDQPMVLAAVQRAQHFTGHTRRRYLDLAATSPLVAVFGQGLPTDLGSGIRGIPLDPSDAFCAEWIVLTLGPNTAAALTAREHEDAFNRNCPDGDRRFDLAITNDRLLVTMAASNMLHRML
jgi:EAL domain-containing protein (putative c-di-GMP-specific phosphodiesterase class I)